MLGEMISPLKEKDITFSFDRAAESAIAKLAFDDKYGARDIRRIIRREVEDKIANILIDSHDSVIEAITVTADGDKITVSYN